MLTRTTWLGQMAASLTPITGEQQSGPPGPDHGQLAEWLCAGLQIQIDAGSSPVLSSKHSQKHPGDDLQKRQLSTFFAMRKGCVQLMKMV